MIFSLIINNVVTTRYDLIYP